jgi:dimethylamine monooxygenase subunit A
MSLDHISTTYAPFESGTFRLSMNIKPLAEAQWLEPEPDLATKLAAKRKLLETWRDEVFAAEVDSAAAAKELLDLMALHLPAHHPTLYRLSGTRLDNLATGEVWELDRSMFHPLDIAGRLVPEDFCLLQERAGRLALTAASLCAPSRWRLAEKLGQPLSAIHGPVPGYGETLAAPVDRFLARLKPEHPVWRLNWGIADDPEPFQPEPGGAMPSIDAAAAGEKLWLRVERQTLRRLSRSGAVVFTIRTYITRLDAAVTSPDQASALAAAIRDMAPAMQIYKQIAPVAAPLLAWLEARQRMA